MRSTRWYLHTAGKPFTSVISNDSVKQSSQVKQSSSSSYTSSSSSETSSKIEKWSPTGHIAVDAYLNTPQIKIILRAKALRELAHKLSNTDKLYEVEAEVIGIEEKENKTKKVNTD